MCFNKEMRGKIMNYIYDYISEERKKEIAYMNIVDTYNRTGYLDIPGDKVVKSKDEYFLFWYNSPDTLCLRQQIEETGSSSIGKKRYMLIYGDKYMNIEISNENWKEKVEFPDDAHPENFNMNTDKLKIYNTIDMSFLRDCEYKIDICKMLSEYIHGDALWFKIKKNKIFIDDEMIVEEFLLKYIINFMSVKRENIWQQ